MQRTSEQLYEVYQSISPRTADRNVVTATLLGIKEALINDKYINGITEKKENDLLNAGFICISKNPEHLYEITRLGKEFYNWARKEMKHIKPIYEKGLIEEDIKSRIKNIPKSNALYDYLVEISAKVYDFKKDDLINPPERRTTKMLNACKLAMALFEEYYTNSTRSLCTKVLKFNRVTLNTHLRNLPVYKRYNQKLINDVVQVIEGK